MRNNENDKEVAAPDSDIIEAAFEDEYIQDEDDIIIISSDDNEVGEDDMYLDIAFNDEEESLF